MESVRASSRMVVRAFAAAGALAPALCAAQQRGLPDTRPPIEEVVSRLDDPLFAVRQRATSDLATRDDLTLARLESMLADEPLSPEQRLRITAVARAVFERGPHAAMGIRFASGDDTQPARIQQPQPGFDAARVLMPGDQVLEADGFPIPQQGILRSLILSHSPGDSLPLKIRRDGREIETGVVLGSFAELDGAGSPRPVDLLAAWQLRRSRAGLGERERVIEPGVIEPRVAEPGRAPERGSREWHEAFASADAPDSLVIGGQARQSADLSLAELAARDASLARASADTGPVQGDLERQLVWFRSQRVAMAQSLSDLEARLARGEVTAVERQVLQRDIASLRDSIGRFDQQIRALEAAIRASIPRR